MGLNSNTRSLAILTDVYNLSPFRWLIFTILFTLGGSDLKVPGTEERVRATRHVTMAELAKTKRQFINYAKTRAIEDVGKLATMFVQYLNSTLFNWNIFFGFSTQQIFQPSLLQIWRHPSEYDYIIYNLLITAITAAYLENSILVLTHERAWQNKYDSTLKIAILLTVRDKR